jgi:hypothetical protein
LENSVEAISDDDEDYTPRSDSRMTRSSSKVRAQKPHPNYVAVAETRV